LGRVSTRRGFLGWLGAAAAAAVGLGGWQIVRSAGRMSRVVEWDPTARQSIESDTTFLMDPAADAAARPARGPATGGFLDFDPAKPAHVTPGRYLEGFHRGAAASSFKWMPCDGMLGAGEFTVEFQARCAADWTAVEAGSIVSIGSAGDAVTIDVGPRSLRATLQHAQNPASPGQYSAFADHPLHPGDLSPGVWQSIAVTLKDGLLTLYLNKMNVAEAPGVVPPSYWGCNSDGDGIAVPAFRQVAEGAFTVSDLRTSRAARVPGPFHLPPSGSVITVNRTPTGQTIHKLCGGLHGIAVGQPPSNLVLGAATQPTDRGLQVLRVANTLQPTPMKAGGIDARHPSRGHSGAYSYDWQVVDRTLAYAIATLGCEAYVGLDSLPHLLGGASPPFTGAALTSGLTSAGAYNRGPVARASISAFATMCADLVWHIYHELHYGTSQVRYFTVWNEPDQEGFWNLGPAAADDYLALYAAVAAAVKAVMPAGARIGGPEVSSWPSSREYVHNLMMRCGRAVPLDFVSWHWYSAQLGEFAQVASQVPAWSAAAKLPVVPELVASEGNWAGGGNLTRGPWTANGADYMRNDWGAAAIAASLVRAQAAGVQRYITCDATVGDLRNLWNYDGVAQAPYNVFRLWAMMTGMDVLVIAMDADPGVHCVAAQDHEGRVFVFLASLHYRKIGAQSVVLVLPGVPDGSAVLSYRIDDAHANFLDTGGARSALEASPADPVTGGRIRIVLEQRAVALLRITPASVGSA
jgi:hypothetical protein